MRIAYICLSPTLGMHQYTADLANRMAAHGHDIHVVGTTHLPADRYAPDVQRHTPLNGCTTGFSVEGLHGRALLRLRDLVDGLQAEVNHFTAPHAWNPVLMRWRRQGGDWRWVHRRGRWVHRTYTTPVVHTLHDLDPHQGSRSVSSLLIPFWNQTVLRFADHILVHGQIYRQRLLDHGLAPARVTAIPLLHLMFSHTAETALRDQAQHPSLNTPNPPASRPFALFFGRLLPYKGLDVLLSAWQRLGEPAQRLDETLPSLVVAGPGELGGCWQGALPAGVELRNRWIGDEETASLFSQCAMVVLPYVSATQSALVAAAYFFGKPVIVAASGALAEYVQPGVTGWITPSGDAKTLAETIAFALADPTRLRQMGSAARRWYDQQRALEDETLQNTYDRLAGSDYRPERKARQKPKVTP